MKVEEAARRVIERVDALDAVARCPVLVVGSEAARSAVLRHVADAVGTNVVPLGPALAEALLSPQAGTAAIPAVIARMADDGAPLLLDRVEILFEPALRIGAVDCLVQVARRVRLCAAWPGRLVEGRLRYAEHHHPECTDEDAARVVVVDTDAQEGPQ